MSGEPVELSLVLPAYNEVSRLPPSLEKIRLHLDAAGRSYEVLVVDDGSRDGTREMVEQAQGSWPQLQLIVFDHNQGKGAAVRAGMLTATGQLRLFSDADLSTPIEEMAKLEQAISAGAGVAIGSRAVAGSQIELHQPLYRELMGKTYNQALRLLVLPGLRDTQCGFKMFTALAAVSCFTPLQTPGFGFDAEVLLRARLQALPIAEIPVVWRNSAGTRVSSLRDGGQMLADLVRLRRRVGSNHRSGNSP
ncbi:MAG TPA: dolichyl-phosphate beta-glucosyltransferase [Candidatus Dormibacteraeota bacterium]|nr:dolichyl-phosphate beta-glucosyltransferase [Candidatus Dormibacteraeota bacterium]